MDPRVRFTQRLIMLCGDFCRHMVEVFYARMVMSDACEVFSRCAAEKGVPRAFRIVWKCDAFEQALDDLRREERRTIMHAKRLSQWFERWTARIERLSAEEAAEARSSLGGQSFTTANDFVFVVDVPHTIADASGRIVTANHQFVYMLTKEPAREPTREKTLGAVSAICRKAIELRILDKTRVVEEILVASNYINEEQYDKAIIHMTTMIVESRRCVSISCPNTSSSSSSSATYKCSKCLAARYCSSECQHHDWPTHRERCAQFADFIKGTYMFLEDMRTRDH